MLVSASWAAIAADAPVLVLGDSLSAGYGISREAAWPQLLGQRMREEGYRQSVVNASISGETTAGGARRLPELLATHRPAVVVIALGANDGLRGFGVGELERNLADMIARSRAAGAAVVLVKVRIPPNYGPRYTEAFEGVYDALSAGGEVVAAPFLLERFATRNDAFQADGLHPVAAVQGDIVATVWPAIETALDMATETSVP
ncbi:MAG: arylesterase [Gammaproteobacteria bacterium]